jgi:hypothetical protein
MAVTNVLFSTGRPQQTPITRLVFQSFVFLYFLSGLAAYKFGPIPFSWLAQFGFIALAVGVIFYTDRIRPLPGAVLLALFLVWAFIVTAVHIDDFSGAMPKLATLPYWAFIVFRYLGIISFISALYVTNWLVSEGMGRELLRWIVLCAVVICVFSLYLYLAHMFNLPEPSRNRAGTAGAEQATKFSGEGFFYNRAVGTFREPGHLAEWLILPFFLSFAFRERWDKIRTYVITGTIALTVSMMALFCIVSAGLGGLILTRPFSKRTIKIVGAAVFVGGVIFMLLSSIQVGTMGEETVTIGTIVQSRVGSILFGGIGASNRNYVYQFMADNPFPALGMGIGNGNLLFAHVLGNDTIVAFLSLYLFTLYGAGYPGMILLGAFLLRPIVQYVWSFKRTIPVVPVILMAYIGYLVASFVASEELSTWFGISTGLFACEASHLWYVRKKFRVAQRQSSGSTLLGAVTGLSPLRDNG